MLKQIQGVLLWIFGKKTICFGISVLFFVCSCTPCVYNDENNNKKN